MQYQFVHNEQHVCMNVYYVNNVHVIIIHVHKHFILLFKEERKVFG